LIDYDSNTIFEAYIENADPSVVKTTNGNIYAIPSGSGPVIDSFQGGVPIRANSSIFNYNDCYMAYQDTDGNYQLSSSDKIYIFKDFESDGSLDVIDGDSISIKIGNDVILNKSI
jgi:hypothetical protein